MKKSEIFKTRANPALDAAILNAIGSPMAALHGSIPDEANEPDLREFENLRFLHRENCPPRFFRTLEKNGQRGGKGISWDGIAWSGRESRRLILIEAKANQPEVCSSPSQAGEKSLTKIRSELAQVRSTLGIRGRFSWTNSYYSVCKPVVRTQLFDGTQIRVRSRLSVFFTGETFPDGTPCPRDPIEWRELIRACHLSLGLATPSEPDKLLDHELGKRVHDVFLPVL